MRLTTICFLLVFAVMIAGCNDAQNTAPPTMNPVSGKVIYDGKPVEGVEVALIPVDAPKVPTIPQNPHATTKADGTFTIGTFEEADGAAEGEYLIVLKWPIAKSLNSDEEEESENSDRLFGWYDVGHSRLRVHVKSGPNTVPEIKIPKIKGAPRPPKGIPGMN